jgi:hypothetical protein
VAGAIAFRGFGCHGSARRESDRLVGSRAL